MIKYLGGALGAAVLFMAPAPAQAAEQCYGAGVGGTDLFLCVDVALNAGDTTVAPTVSVRCEGSYQFCRFIHPPQIGVGTTGFVPNPQFPQPCVDPKGPTVRSSGGTIGTFYVNGIPAPVNIPPFVLGNPNGC
jgi:hypothetical protein